MVETSKVFGCASLSPQTRYRFFFLLLYFPKKRKKEPKEKKLIKFATSASRNYMGKLHDQVCIQDCGCSVLIGDQKIRLDSGRTLPPPLYSPVRWNVGLNLGY